MYIQIHIKTCHVCWEMMMSVMKYAERFHHCYIMSYHMIM